jgi:hypothetical protein
MNMKIIDAFGTHIGDAEVKWITPEGNTPRQAREYRGQILRELSVIFEPELTVLLPTKNERTPWRLEITP